MELLENGLLNINKEMNKCISKQKRIYNNTIYFTAKNILNKLNQLPETYTPFNPSKIFDIKTNSVINPEDYNHSVGFLPNRMKISTFTIENGYYTTRLNNNELVNGRLLLYCNEHKRATEIFKETTLNFKFVLNCGCKYIDNVNKLTQIDDSHFSLKTKEFISTSSITFELDNYMNLFYPDSNMYLIYNLLPYNLQTFELIKSITDGKILKNMKVEKTDIDVINLFLNDYVKHNFPEILNIYNFNDLNTDNHNHNDNHNINLNYKKEYSNILFNIDKDRENALINNIIKHSNIKDFILDGLKIIDDANV